VPAVARHDDAAVTFTVNTESTYDWREDDLAMPVNLMVGKVTRWGDQLVSVGGGLRYWVETTDTSPEGIGFRFIVTLLYPRG
jgi:hypothetical protein